MKIFIICPVRIVTEEQKEEIEEYVEKLESEGHEVHYAPRDVDQSDPVGYDICCAHRKAMRESDRVDIFWDSESTGSHFDLGQAFALRVPWKLVKTYQEDTEGKSFEKVIREVREIQEAVADVVEELDEEEWSLFGTRIRETIRLLKGK